MDTHLPALRKVWVRGISGALSVPGKVACLPSVNTGPCLGYSCMGHQSSEVACAYCEVGGGVLARWGPNVKGAVGAKKGIGTARQSGAPRPLRRRD